MVDPSRHGTKYPCGRSSLMGKRGRVLDGIRRSTRPRLTVGLDGERVLIVSTGSVL